MRRLIPVLLAAALSACAAADRPQDAALPARAPQTLASAASWGDVAADMIGELTRGFPAAATVDITRDENGAPFSSAYSHLVAESLIAKGYAPRCRGQESLSKHGFVPRVHECGEYEVLFKVFVYDADGRGTGGDEVMIGMEARHKGEVIAANTRVYRLPPGEAEFFKPTRQPEAAPGRDAPQQAAPAAAPPR
jgi:hypothetical protein